MTKIDIEKEHICCTISNNNDIQVSSKGVPEKDDLILNIPDGGFYRVLSVDEVEIQTQRLAISGTGGGGSGSGGGPSNEGSLVINYITPQNSSTITGVDYYIDFEIVAKDSAGDDIIDTGTATWKINGKEFTQTVSNGKNSFKVDEYLDPTQSSTKIILVVNMNTGGTTNSIVSKTWYVKAVSLGLTWNYEYNERNYVSGNNFTLSWYSSGGVDCTAHIIFDNNYNALYFSRCPIPYIDCLISRNIVLSNMLLLQKTRKSMILI